MSHQKSSGTPRVRPTVPAVGDNALGGEDTVPGEYAVGIDIGSTNTKVALVAGAPFAVLALASEPTPRHADRLLAGVRRMVAEVVAAAPHPPRAVGVASMAETGAPLGDADRPLCPLVRWDADRPGGGAGELIDRYGAGTLFAATGVRPSPKVPLAVWAYLRRTEPALWSALRRWAGVADLVVLSLTGRLVTDHTLAGRTMAYRLPPSGAPLSAGFDPDLLAAVGLRPEQLPEVATPGEPAGTVSAAAAAATGLPAGTPVVVAGHDHAVGAAAAGVRAPGQVADSVGTAEAVVRVLDTAPDRARVAAAGMSLVRTVAGDREAVLAGFPGAGGFLRRWVVNHGGLRGDEVLQAAARLPDGPTGVLVLPYPNGRQAPHPDPSARVAVRGSGDDAVRTRAAAEGLALHARWMLAVAGAVPHPSGTAGATRRAATSPDRRGAEVPDRFGAAFPDRGGAGAPLVEAVAGGTGAAEVTMLGAGSLPPLWPRLKAAVLPVPVRWARVDEPVAAGAALLAAARTGMVADPVLPAEPLGAPDPRYDPVFVSFVRYALGET